MASKTLLKAFSEETSSHGVRRIFTSAPSYGSVHFGRAMWCFAWLVAAAYSIYQIRIVIYDYMQYESMTKYRIRDNGYIAFPAVTVCFPNSLKWSLVVEWLDNCDSNNSICWKYTAQMEADKRAQILALKDRPWLLDFHSDLVQHGYKEDVLRMSYPIQELIVQNRSLARLV